jgi:hypothetical protein
MRHATLGLGWHFRNDGIDRQQLMGRCAQRQAHSQNLDAAHSIEFRFDGPLYDGFLGQTSLSGATTHGGLESNKQK